MISQIYISLISQTEYVEFTERFIDNGSVVRKLNLNDILIIWLSWPDSLGMGGVRISSSVSVYHPRASPITDSDLTASIHEYDEYSRRRSLLISRDLLCYTSFVETYPLLNQLLDNGYKVLGHDVNPIPVITFH